MIMILFLADLHSANSEKFQSKKLLSLSETMSFFVASTSLFVVSFVSSQYNYNYLNTMQSQPALIILMDDILNPMHYQNPTQIMTARYPSLLSSLGQSFQQQSQIFGIPQSFNTFWSLFQNSINTRNYAKQQPMLPQLDITLQSILNQLINTNNVPSNNQINGNINNDQIQTILGYYLLMQLNACNQNPSAQCTPNNIIFNIVNNNYYNSPNTASPTNNPTITPAKSPTATPSQSPIHPTSAPSLSPTMEPTAPTTAPIDAVCNQLTSPATIPLYQKNVGTKCSGNDLLRDFVGSAEECAQWCNNDSRCTGFERVNTDTTASCTGKCHFKSGSVRPLIPWNQDDRDCYMLL